MTNWNYNTLTVSSEKNKKQLHEFIKAVKNPEKEAVLSLSSLLPCPAELLEKDALNRSDDYCAELIMKYGHANWYDWSMDNWGTKWDLIDSIIANSDEDCITYYFLSASGPPTVWIGSVAEMFPDLCFELHFKDPYQYKGVFTASGKNKGGYYTECSVHDQNQVN